MKVLTKIIIGSFLFLEPAKAMNEEETSNLPRTQSIQLHPPKTQSSSLTTSFESLPNVLVGSIFKFLDVNDLGRTAQVSTRWKKVTESPGLWKYMGLKYYGDFLNEEDLKENPKQKNISHYLSVIVNAIEDLKQIDRFVSLYQLDLYVPYFEKYMEAAFLTDLVTDHTDCEEFIVQGNKEAIKRKIERLSEGKYGYKKNPTTIRELNELLVEKGDPKAVERKVNGLETGMYGYEHDQEEAKKFNESLVEKGDPEAIDRKLYGLLHGNFAYKSSPSNARKFNDFLVENGNPVAIERKISGFWSKFYVEEKDLLPVKEANDLLVKQGNSAAIERKIKGLYNGTYGYPKNLTALREFNELLVEKGNQKAVKRANCRIIF